MKPSNKEGIILVAGEFLKSEEMVDFIMDEFDFIEEVDFEPANLMHRFKVRHPLILNEGKEHDIICRRFKSGQTILWDLKELATPEWK